MLESGKMPVEEFIGELLKMFGRRLDAAHSGERLWTVPFERGARLRTGMVRIIVSLREDGYPVYALTNTSMPHLRIMKEKGWLDIFDGVLALFELGSVKPDPVIFRESLDRIGASAGQIVFVDDNSENVRSARSFGIGHVIRFRSLAPFRKEIAMLVGQTSRSKAVGPPSRRPHIEGAGRGGGCDAPQRKRRGAHEPG